MLLLADRAEEAEGVRAKADEPDREHDQQSESGGAEHA